MAKNSAQAPTEKPEAQKGSAAKMPLFSTKFDGSGSDNTDEFRRTLTGHIELQPVAIGPKPACSHIGPFWPAFGVTLVCI